MAASPSLVRIEPESVILFRMTGGRIYHQGLALQFPDVTMRTYGSVGLDDSLKLMVETSVPLTWLPSNAVTDAIKKQKMQIPVGGTLKSPQLDLGELARVKSQFLGNLGVLESAVEPARSAAEVNALDKDILRSCWATDRPGVSARPPIRRNVGGGLNAPKSSGGVELGLLQACS